MRRLYIKAAGLSAVCAALAISACSFDDLLKVENPEELPVNELDDPSLLEVRLNGVVDAFDVAYVDQVIQYATFLTDEMITGLNWEDYARVNERIASYLEGPTAGIYENLQEGVRLGDGLAEHIRGWAADDPETDFDPALATSLIYAGYSTVVLAENMCQAVFSPDPDNPSGEVLSQSETFAVALPYLEEGLSVAQGISDPDLDDLAAELENLALTGLARGNLGMGNWADAAAYANQVSPGFVRWIEFVDLPNGRNPLQGTSHGGNFTHGINPLFMGTHPSFDATGFAFRDNDVIDPQTDPRIQHLPEHDTGHNGLTPLYKFIQGLRYSGYTGQTISDVCPGCTGTSPESMNLLTDFDTGVMLADYLEAQHHYHEALAMQGGNEGTVLAFVNARRAVGNQDPVNVTGQDLIDELRNQRARDLFMGGFRLPDLRRWTIHDPGNGPFEDGSYFPTGEHPNFPVWGVYQDWTCFPIPLSEYEGNPNLAPPANPNVPPAI